MKSILVRFDDGLAESLRIASKAVGLTQSAYIRQSLVAFMAPKSGDSEKIDLILEILGGSTPSGEEEIALQALLDMGFKPNEAKSKIKRACCLPNATADEIVAAAMKG